MYSKKMHEGTCFRMIPIIRILMSSLEKQLHLLNLARLIEQARVETKKHIVDPPWVALSSNQCRDNGRDECPCVLTA